MKKTEFEKCEDCRNVLSEADLNRHLLVALKDYKQTFDHSGYLNYCSIEFVDCVSEYERVFLYFFNKYRHYHLFKSSLMKFALANCRKPKLCCDDLFEKLLSQFFKSRIFQSVKKINKSFEKKRKKSGDKLIKLSHE